MNVEVVGKAVTETVQSGEQWFARGVIRRLRDTGLTEEQAKAEFVKFIEAVMQAKVWAP